MNIHAKIPVRITGYGSPRAECDAAPEPQERKYFVGNQETPIAVVKVMRYADEDRMAGFMFEGQIYQDIYTVDVAVSEYVAKQLLHAYETLLTPIPHNSIPSVWNPSIANPPFSITTMNGDRWTHTCTTNDPTKQVYNEQAQQDREWDEATEQVLRDRAETWKELADL